MKHRRKHPGVVLIPPDIKRRIGWRARFTEPDSEKQVKVTLSPLLRTTELREDWAAKKSKELAKRRLQLEEGAPRATGTGLSDAVDQYYKAHTTLGQKTLKDYRAATDKLLGWAAANGVRAGDDLTRAKLLGFREQIINEPKRAAAAKGKRGARKVTRVKRSAYSVNRELRSVRVVLGYLAELDLLAKIHEGDLRRALKKLPVTVERKAYLSASDVRQLFESALVHDAERYAETRDEHAGKRPVGTTPRYVPAAPFIALVLLTGMRLGEATKLEWRQVDLEAVDEEGRAIGEIHLTGETKTKRARTIDLAVSPALRTLLEELRRGGKDSICAISDQAAAMLAKRLKDDYGAPAGFGWQVLRSTCATYLANSSIFGSATVFKTARQLGHSIIVCEKHYLGLVRVPREARTLEAAMQIEQHLERVLEATKARAK